MNLIHAQRCAERLITWLAPFCERIQTAGSIRRERPECGDVDLVIIPKMDIERDMLGAVLGHKNQVRDEIVRRAAEEKNWKLERGHESHDTRAIIFTARGIQADIWFATRETWGTVLLTRTGSKEHNIWLVDRAKRRGEAWSPRDGITKGLARIADTEERIYAAIGLPFIEPKDREAATLQRLFPC